MGVFTDFKFDRYSKEVYSDASVYSDWFKDAHGVRPNLDDEWYAFFASLSDEERSAYMTERANEW